MYVFGGGLGVAVIRALLSVPMHSCVGVVMGSYVGRAKFEADAGSRRRLLWLGFLLPAFGHGLFDFFVLSIASEPGLGLALLFLLLVLATVVAFWIIALRLVHRAQLVSPFKKPTPLEAPLMVFGGTAKD
jgi:RsiW-degrading membrane proteinase PrsW (M82 family)